MLPLQRQNDIFRNFIQTACCLCGRPLQTALFQWCDDPQGFKKLEADGLIKRTHGGAAIIESTTSEFPLALRESENMEQKTLLLKSAPVYPKWTNHF